MISGQRLASLASLVFRPCDPELIGPSSIDVTLSDTFFTPRKPDLDAIDLSNLPTEEEMYDRVLVDKWLKLYPKQFVKALTHEKFNMPTNVVGMFSLRSAMAQAGLEQSTSVWIRPNWEGHLVLELSNLTNKPLILRPGLRIGQVHFFKLK
jgi:dCTP deaminase